MVELADTASMGECYGPGFYEGWASVTASSAGVIVPMILALTNARSVVDFGCGSGLWLAQFRSAGVSTIRGYDGPWVDAEALPFPRDCFVAADLAQRIEVGRHFDLAISLEVAEHLPAQAADTFVATLTSAADVVMFSASIKCQGGVGHVNEQWPDYWVARFADHNFVVVDAIRGEVWDDLRVATFYRQNVGVYVRADKLAAYPALEAASQATGGRFPALVHPDTYQQALDRAADVRGLMMERAKERLGPLRPVAARARRLLMDGVRSRSRR